MSLYASAICNRLSCRRDRLELDLIRAGYSPALAKERADCILDQAMHESIARKLSAAGICTVANPEESA